MSIDYIGSQQHWEDNINADYDERERHSKQPSGQVDNRTQPDDRQQCYKTGKECKYKCSGLCKESC